MQETWEEPCVRSLGWEDPLKEEMATHSSIPAWKIPLTKEPGWATVRGITGSGKTEHQQACTCSLIR